MLQIFAPQQVNLTAGKNNDVRLVVPPSSRYASVATNAATEDDVV